MDPFHIFKPYFFRSNQTLSTSRRLSFVSPFIHSDSWIVRHGGTIFRRSRVQISARRPTVTTIFMIVSSGKCRNIELGHERFVPYPFQFIVSRVSFDALQPEVLTVSLNKQTTSRWRVGWQRWDSGRECSYWAMKVAKPLLLESRATGRDCYLTKYRKNR